MIKSKTMYSLIQCHIKFQDMENNTFFCILNNHSLIPYYEQEASNANPPLPKPRHRAQNQFSQQNAPHTHSSPSPTNPIPYKHTLKAVEQCEKFGLKPLCKPRFLFCD